MKVKVLVLPDGKMPEYKTALASGADAHVRTTLTIGAGQVRKVPLGISVEFAKSHELQVRPRSGHSLNGLVVILGTIDADYRGEVHATCHNVNAYDVTIKQGTCIAQLVLVPIERATFVAAESLSSTARGHGGYGSTGL